MKNVFLLILVTLLLSCSGNRSQTNFGGLKNQGTEDDLLVLELPNWFLNMPSDSSLAPGIAPADLFNPETTEESIKENASIIANRNESAIVIAKLKMRDSQDNLTPILTSFRLQVAEDIPNLKKYYESCQIIDRVTQKGMTIGLVGPSSLDIQLDTKTQLVIDPPHWYREDAYITEDNWLVSSGKSTSFKMDNAYLNAYSEAVYKLIAGIKPEVSAAIINSQNYTEKFLEIDASLIIENLKNTRNSLLLTKRDNSYLYEGYVELKWRPAYRIKELKVLE
ncbi:hypothetical protein JEZ13_08600 [bacterium]|nr:hypothetical protein [bacterium]